jgi:uncharacterized membrane protein YidH (DUF202 family)
MIKTGGINMDSNVISTLNEIKVAIYVLLVIVTIGTIANAVRAWASAKNLIRKELDDLFTIEAGNFYEEASVGWARCALPTLV